MRIMFCNDYGAPVGGAEKYVFGVAEELLRRGHRLAWLISEEAGTDLPGDARFTVPARRSSSRTARGLRELGNPVAFRAMRRAVEHFRPDVVHFHCIHQQLSEAVLLGRGGARTVATVHDHKPICPISVKARPGWRPCDHPFGRSCLVDRCLTLPHYLQARLRQAVYRRAWRSIDCLLAPSRYLAERLEEAGLGKAIVLPPGIPPTRGTADAPAREGDYILFLGRLTAQKGPDVLLAAAVPLIERHPGLRLIVAGDGPMREGLAAMSSRLGIAGRVEFTGRVSEAGSLISGALATVVPSRSPEGFGLVALEAMAHGSPVVASACGGLPEILGEGSCGLLVPPGDPERLAAALESIIADPPARARLRDLARLRAAEFDFSDHVDRLIAIYRRLRGTTEESSSLTPGCRHR